MTTRPIALIPAACISLLLMFAPTAAVPQDQKNPSEQQPEKNITEPPQSQLEPASAPSATAESAQQPQTAGPKKEEPETAAGLQSTEYIIKPGDTLWDISNAYLKDPFLWPFIWKANPDISNPDLIYAGNKLIIPNLAPIERAMQANPSEEATQRLVSENQAPAKEKITQPENQVAAPETGPLEGMEVTRAMQKQSSQPEEATAGGINKLILPEEQKKPIIDKYAMLSAGFVSSEKGTNFIVGAPGDSKTIFGFGDTVYVKFTAPGDVNVGDKFLIYRPMESVEHPLTGKHFGHLIRGLGVLQITAKDTSADVFTALITLSFDQVEIHSFLTPYQEPVLIYPSPEKKTKDISGYILEVATDQTIVGQTYFVYIDKGSADGVDPGDNFIVYDEPAKRGDPKSRIGEVQVFLVKEHSSTAIVRKSSDVITKGNIVDYKD